MSYQSAESESQENERKSVRIMCEVTNILNDGAQPFDLFAHVDKPQPNEYTFVFRGLPGLHGQGFPRMSQHGVDWAPSVCVELLL